MGFAKTASNDKLSVEVIRVAEVGRRKFIRVLGVGAGLVATGFAAVPFVQSLGPSDNPWVSGRLLSIDIGKIPPGGMHVFTWNGRPIMVINRLQRWTDSVAELEAQMFDESHPRRKRPQWLIVIGVCTHLGCIPSWNSRSEMANEEQPFWCECHGSSYGYAGEPLTGPAPEALHVPEHFFASDTTVIIGTSDSEAISQVHNPQTTGHTQKLPANPRRAAEI